MPAVSFVFENNLFGFISGITKVGCVCLARASFKLAESSAPESDCSLALRVPPGGISFVVYKRGGVGDVFVRSSEYDVKKGVDVRGGGG